MSRRSDQIAQSHAPLILAVVQACQNPGLRPGLEPALKASADNGWQELVRAIRRVLDGERSPALLMALDDEDQAIIETILRGLQDPATLPAPEATADATSAAPGLAGIIHAAAHGDHGALEWLGEMAEQMQKTGGDMARVGAILRRIMDGEREPELLCKGMGAAGEKLVLDILSELGRLQTH